MKSMAYPFLLLIISSLLLIPARTHLQSNEPGHISVVLYDKGIDFAKDLLIKKAVSSAIPLHLSDIERYVKIPIVGKVRVVLSSITINTVDVSSSSVETGDTGVSVIASGATADLTMNWKYSYKNWVVEISDSGSASVQVNGMKIWLTASVKEQDGTLKLTMLDHGCHVKGISINMDGGASWLYQVLVDAFEGPISTAIQNAISNKLKDGILKLDSRLQSLPKQVSIDHISAMNVAFADDPLFNDSSVKVDISGLFTAVNDVLIPSYYYKDIPASDSLSCPSKMVALLLHESVFNSAAEVYFNAGYMHWTVDRFLNQSLLNTATWRFLYPRLYEQYPDHDMNLNVTVTNPPFIRITKNIEATIHLDVTVNVLDANEVVPVACVSLVLSSSCSPHILRNKLAGFLKLRRFSVYGKWSSIGDIHLIRPIAFAVVETEIIPYVNIRLMRGFQIPGLNGFELKNAEVHYAASKMMICSNIALT